LGHFFSLSGYHKLFNAERVIDDCMVAAESTESNPSDEYHIQKLAMGFSVEDSSVKQQFWSSVFR
jgi:hypothetical protein